MSELITLRAMRNSILNYAFAAAALVIALAAPARAEKLVVVEARGVGETAGEIMDSSTPVNLLIGEHLTLIGENGNQYCLDGPYAGPAERQSHGSRASGWFEGLLGGMSRDDVDPLTDCVK